MSGWSTRYLPFMVLPLYGALAKLDQSLLEAAADLGAGRGRSSGGVTLPLSLPGIAAGSLLVLHSGGRRVRHPRSARRPDTLMIGKVLWDEFFNNRDWPAASAVAVGAGRAAAVPLLVAQRLLERERRGMSRRSAPFAPPR